MTAVIAGILGAMVGSFLNVVIYRLPRPGLSIHYPKRSKCPGCGRQIPGYENIPILSYFLLRGRCRGCKRPIPVRYMLIEAGTAALFLVLAVVHSPWTDEGLGVTPISRLLLFTVYLAALSAAIAVAAIDWDLKIIPNEITIGWTLCAVTAGAWLPAVHGSSSFSWTFSRLDEWELPIWVVSYAASVSGALVGFFGLWFLAWVFERILGREALGLGDVKYLGAIGALFGPERALCVLAIASVVGALIGSLMRVFRGDKEVPFGPFLSLGVAIIIFDGDTVIHWLLFWPRYVIPT